MKIAVLGAGTMGRGIAYAASLAGCHVALYDQQQGAADRAVEEIAALSQGAVDRNKLAADEAVSLRTRVGVAQTLSTAVGDVDLVIESVVEDLRVKRELLVEVERLAPPAAILASNTSALSITAVMSDLTVPSRGIGMHFFNPAYAMKLVEVVSGLETSPETVERTTSMCKQLGKIPVAVNDQPGFVTSRINVIIGNEAFRMLQEGVATARDIDTALKLGLNHPMGPFELVDLVGLDVRLSVLQGLHRDLGEQFRPAPLLVKYVNAGRLGRKVGRGVFDYAVD